MLDYTFFGIALLILATMLSLTLIGYYVSVCYFLYLYKPKNNKFEELCRKNKIIGVQVRLKNFACVYDIYADYSIIFYDKDIEKFSDKLQELIFIHESLHLKGVVSEKEVWERSKNIMLNKYGIKELQKIIWEEIWSMHWGGDAYVKDIAKGVITPEMDIQLSKTGIRQY